eukprot:TRINITY_DN542_c0_g1_i1.p1 TRINITY_DN542_c0_g1~~TRINITY_DN542_c0_g1_i1.p1  ORF type:complete len:413 (+),score=101.40 TRINITY_DN542_c0_g1_i1:58-1239(+)
MAKNQKLVNIPRDIDDEFHRYKMPVLQAKIEGRGNGIKTVLMNIKAIAESLERPATYPTKFFGFELGALTKCDEEKERYVVNGRHDAENLAQVLDTFIDKFVLCKNCDRNPETEMLILGNKNIQLKCKACGGRTPVDMTHRLSTYILKNPPPKDTKAQSGKSAKGQKAGDNARNLNDFSDKDFQNKLVDTKNVEWSQDTSEDAVAKRRAAQVGEGQVGSLVAGDSASNASLQELADILERGNSKNVVDEVARLGAKEGWSDKKLFQNVFSTLFGTNFLRSVKKKAPVLAQFVTEEIHQKIVLLGLEKICASDKQVIEHLPAVFQVLYLSGAIEEGIILKWHSHPTKRLPPKTSKLIRDKAQPFIKWLQEAEVESEEDEVEDEDEDGDGDNDDI